MARLLERNPKVSFVAARAWPRRARDGAWSKRDEVSKKFENLFSDLRDAIMGLEHEPPAGGPANFSILTNRSAIQIISPESQTPRIP